MSRLKPDACIAVMLLISAFFIGTLLFLNGIYAPFSDYYTKSYRYPGNGVPFLSVNKRITNLENEIGDYAQKFQNIRPENGKLFIDKVQGFKFVSLKEIDIQTFSMKVGLEIKNGTCDIGFGDIHIKVARDNMIVEKKGKVIGNEEVTNIHSIGIHNWPKASTKGAFDFFIQTNGIPIDIPFLKLERPSHITIELSNDFTGTIGPWVWLRGFD